MSDANQETSTLDRLRERLRELLRPKGQESILESLEDVLAGEGSADRRIGAQERVLMRNILKLGSLTAYDVMVPRVDIVAVPAETTLGDLVQISVREAHSRLPVYRKSLDDTIGMVHIKDLLPFWQAGREFKLADILRKVLFVAPSMRVLDLLLEMRRTRMHMAIVVDEYGGADGLVTIEDLVESIVGEIEDEHDVEAGPTFVAGPDGTWTVDARLPIAEFERQVGPIASEDERDGDIDTIGGLVVATVGRVPGRGEVVAHHSGYEFEVLEADPRRLKKLRVRSPKAAASPE